MTLNKGLLFQWEDSSLFIRGKKHCEFSIITTYDNFVLSGFSNKIVGGTIEGGKQQSKVNIIYKRNYET